MIRTFLIIFITVSITATALAQDAAPPRFFIERIEVRKTRRVSPDLVKAETLLREGAEYTEQEIGAASARLSRLPYLLSADLTLEKGSERGRHVLVITVAETKPFFFFIDTRPVLREDRGPARFDYADDDFGGESKEAALGFRWFVGRRGIVHVGVLSQTDRQVFTRDFSAVAAGYTQYDLFGTRAFATFSVRLPEGRWTDATGSPQLTVGMPLTASQTLTLDIQDTHFRDDTQVILGEEIPRRDTERLISLSWTYNTTNHPFAPTRGTIVRVTPLRSMRDRTRFGFMTFPPPTTVVPGAQHITANGVDLAASRYWELSDRYSVSAGVFAGWASVDDTRTDIPLATDVHSSPAYQVLRAGWSRNLWRGDAKAGDSRLELEGRFMARQYNDDRQIGDREKGYQGTVSWARRSSWGMLRVGVGYAWGY